MTPRRTPRVSQHRVGFLPRQRGLVEATLFTVQADGGLLDGQLLGRGQELVQRRVEQAHRHGQAVHGREDGLEVLLLDQAQLLEGVGLLLGRLSQDHAAHDGEAVLAQEHVLGAAQSDALGPELAGVGGVVTGVGVGPHGQVALADLVGPREHGVERGRRLGCGERHLTGDHDARAAIEGDPVTLGQGHATGASRCGRPGGAPRRRRQRACPNPGPRRRRGSPGRPGR